MYIQNYHNSDLVNKLFFDKQPTFNSAIVQNIHQSFLYVHTVQIRMPTCRQEESRLNTRFFYLFVEGVAGVMFPTQVILSPTPTFWQTQNRNDLGRFAKK